MPRKPAEPPETLAGAVGAGNRLRALQRLAEVLVETIGTAEPSSVAALARQLRDTMSEIAALDVPGAVSFVDEIAKRRADRKASAPRVAADRRGEPRGRGRNAGAV